MAFVTIKITTYMMTLCLVVGISCEVWIACVAAYENATIAIIIPNASYKSQLKQINAQMLHDKGCTHSFANELQRIFITNRNSHETARLIENRTTIFYRIMSDGDSKQTIFVGFESILEVSVSEI